MTTKHTWDEEGWRWGVGFRVGRAALVLLIALSGIACGDVTAGGVAESEVTVAGDGAAWAAPNAPASAPSAIVGPPFEGTVSATLRVHLLTAAGDSVPISGGNRAITVDVQGQFPASLGTYAVTPGTYAGVRVVFTGVEAEVTAGLGDLPAPIGGVVTVDLGTAGAIVIEREGPILLEAGSRLEVGVGLGAPAWIAGVALLPPPRVVSPTAFQGAVELVFEVR